MITLKAIPQAPATNGTLYCDIIATVTDHAGRPQADARVNFTSRHRFAQFTEPTGITDAQGQTNITVICPLQTSLQHDAQRVPVTARVADGSVTLTLDLFNPNLRQIRILNTHLDKESGQTLIYQYAIEYGIKIVIVFPEAIMPGSKAVFHWDRHTVNKTVAAQDRAWVIIANEDLPAKDVFAIGKHCLWFSIEDTKGNIISSIPLDTVVSAEQSPVITV